MARPSVPYLVPDDIAAETYDPASHWADLLIPLIVLLPVLWALLPGGLPNTADGTVHFVRATEMVFAWQDGIWLPRWSLNLGYGYGIPLFVYAPPLPYLLTAAFHQVGFAPEAAYKAMLVTALVLASNGAYRLGRALVGVWGGAIAAVGLIYAPVMLRELFIQGNAGQLLAWSFPAWALWAVVRLYAVGRPRHAIALALALTGAFLSHNVVALLLPVLVVLAALWLWGVTRRWRSLLLAAGGSLLGLALSAWFAVPALLEGKYVALDVIAASDYHGRFIPLAELLAWPPRLDTGAINPYFPRTLGLPLVLAAVLGLAAGVVGLWVSTRPRVHPRAEEFAGARLRWGAITLLAFIALFCGVMAHAVTIPLWEMLPYVDLFEFPIRWHGLTIVALSALAGLTGSWARRWPLVGMAMIGLLLGSALVNLYPHKLAVGTRVMTPYAVARYEVRSGAVGTTSLGEFNPTTVTRPLNTSPLVDAYLHDQPVDRLADGLPPGATHQMLEVTAHRQHYRLDLPSPTTVTVALHAFPGWQATANGTPVAISPQPETGLMQLDLPAGSVDLVLTFGPTPLRAAMQGLSALAWVGLGLGVVVMAAQRRRIRVPQRTRAAAQAVGLVALVVVGVWGLQAAGPRWFQLHSAPDQALPADVDLRADFGGRIRLLGVNTLPATVRAGGTLPVVAYWRALDDSDDNAAVELRLVDPTTGEIAATLHQVHPSDIPTSGWATGLYVRNALNLKLPGDLLPIRYSVRVGLYAPSAGRYLPPGPAAESPVPSGQTAGVQGDFVELGRVWVLPAQSPRPPDGPRVEFGGDLHLLGVRQSPDAVTFYWRSDALLPAGLTMFVHLLDANGQLIGQLDGAPYANRYPPAEWLPGQVVEDTRSLAPLGIDPAQIAQVRVGVYQVADGVRLAAVESGNRLPDDALTQGWAQ